VRLIPPFRPRKGGWGDRTAARAEIFFWFPFHTHRGEGVRG
jgi:hypothetical protein